ncbi:MAG: type II toxin-antitoxin system RelE/ParE family toxin [Ignavibacteria bacterium]|nr:type II toxin-antitoxin system RelE/ParE family toxin [Ignavibacteria bacterium]
MVKWTEPAKTNLRKIHDFIATDSPVYAKKFVKVMVERVERIALMPKSGRIVPEFDDENLREIILAPYRVIYGIIGDETIVLAVIHAKQNISGGLP